MAKTSAKKQNKITLGNLSQRDKDFFNLDVKDTMKKYKVEKQAVYDRRFALKKKLKEAGLTIEQVLGGVTEEPAEAPRAKKPGRKPAQKKVEEPVTDNQQLLPAVIEKNVPVLMKPIEINFDNFSVKLNGMPKKISVNPETHAIEIDL